MADLENWRKSSQMEGRFGIDVSIFSCVDLCPFYRMQYAFARVIDPNVGLSNLKLYYDRLTSSVSEQAPKICPDQLVWRRCSRSEKGVIPYSLKHGR